MNGGGTTAGGAGSSGAALGTLSIGLVAEVQQFIGSMRRAIEVLQFFRNEAMTLGKVVGGQFSQMAQQTQAMGGSIKVAMNAAGQQTQKFTGLVDQFGNKIKTTGATVSDTVTKVSTAAATRGKHALGAILDFSAGVKQFLLLNMRWFIIWRSFWAVWGQVQKAVTEFRDLMQETALALRTGVTELGSWVEKQMVGIRIQKEAIAATMRHAIAMKDYIKSFYYLTTAGISASDAFNFVNASIKTAIALDEDHVMTVRLLTGLYNVFGETITDVATRQDKFQKISAILAATFRKQDIELEDYAKALPYIAAQWKQSGNSLEVLIAALGVMGTRFMHGSKTATSLNRSLSMLMRYPERFAKLTGMVFDPKKPLDFLAVLRKMNEALRSGTTTFEQMGFSAEEMGQLYHTLGLRGARAGATLLDGFEDLEVQIQKNTDATFEMVEQMQRMVELTVPKQLQIMTGILRGFVLEMLMAATGTADYAMALEKVNNALRKMTSLFKGVGTAIEPFVGSFKKIGISIASFILTWKVFGKAAVASVGVSKLAFADLLGSTKFSLARMGRLLKYGVAGLKVGAASAGKAIVGSFLVTFIKIVAVIQLVTGLVEAAYAVFTGKFEENAKKHAAKLLMTEKTTWDNILGYIKTFGNLNTIAMRVQTGDLREAWRKHNKLLDEHQAFSIKHNLMTEEDANAHFYKKRVEWLQMMLGEEFDHEKQLQLAREYGFTLEEEQFEKEKDFYKDEWPKLLDDLMKIRLDAFSYELWALKKHFEEMKEEWIADGKAINDLEKWYLEKRQRIIDEYANKGRQAHAEAMSKLEESRITGYQKELRDARQQTDKLKADATLFWIDQIRARAAEIGVSEDTVKKIGTIREKAHEGLTDEQQAFNEISSALAQNHRLAITDIAIGQRDDIAKIDRDGFLNEFEINKKRFNEIQEMEKKWDKEETEILGERYGRHTTEYEQEFAKFQKNNSKHIKEIEDREKEIEKLYEGTGRVQIENEKRVDDVLRELRIKQGEDFKAFSKENAVAYLAYLVKLKKKEVEAVKEGDQEIADSQSLMWLEIKSGIASASADYLESVGTLSDSVQRIFRTMYQGIEEVLTATFMRMAGLEEEYGLESMKLVSERLEESKRSLREQLEDGRISRELYYAELDELDRKYTEEIEKRQTGLVNTLSDLQKSLTKAVLAELSKMLVASIAARIKAWAVEKSITTKSMLLDMKALAVKVYKSFASIPFGLGIPLAIVAIAAIWSSIQKLSGKKVLGLAKGGIFEEAQPAVIGEEGPEAVVPLIREGGRLVLSDQGRRIISPLLSLENRIPELLDAVSRNSGLVHLRPEFVSALGARTSPSQLSRNIELNITFQGDKLDFAGSMPMMDDISAVDRVYDKVWLPAKMRNMERLGETVFSVVNAR